MVVVACWRVIRQLSLVAIHWVGGAGAQWLVAYYSGGRIIVLMVVVTGKRALKYIWGESITISSNCFIDFPRWRKANCLCTRTVFTFKTTRKQLYTNSNENMQCNTNTPWCTGPSKELKCSSSSEKMPVPLDCADAIHVRVLDTEAENTPLVRSPLSESLNFLVRNYRRRKSKELYESKQL